MNTSTEDPLDGRRPIRIGIAGFGTAARSFVPAIQAHPGFELVTVAEPVQAVRDEIIRDHGIRSHESIAEMLADPRLDAVYIATPTERHWEHVQQAMAAGKHVLVEKPMAAKIEHAKAMVAAAEAAGIVFMVGHSHSYDLPIQRMREIITGGSLGRVRMANIWCYTDWMYRPRRPDELDASLGGGVTYRQGSHQFDVLRLLCGGMVRSVKAKTFDWDVDRRGIGAHVVFLEFADGAAATAVYNGYGGFSTMDLAFNINEGGFQVPRESRRWARRTFVGRSAQDELLAKRERAKSAGLTRGANQPFFGITLVSCERGDIRQSPQGLFVYTEEGQTEITLPNDRSPRDLVMAEFHDAVIGKSPALHDGRWGLANLEVCESAIASSASGREVMLAHQVAARQ